MLSAGFSDFVLTTPWRQVQKANQGLQTIQKCSGMYGPHSWGGEVDPFILTRFEKYEGGADPVVSLIVFDWRDFDYIGKYRTPDSALVRSPTFSSLWRPTDHAGSIQKETICDDESVNAQLCNDTQIGEFILGTDSPANLTSVLLTQAVHLKDASPVKYPIKRTGYYCVGTYGYSADEYQAVVEFRNAYGELPAAQIPKLPFYGVITIVYAVIAAFWAFLYVQHRHDILAVQNYITAILVFLIVEMVMTWGFYDYQNRHGVNALARVFMVLVAILNAWRNSFSFFLLLIVCMGYGVVKPSLGKTMLYVRGLAVAHFIFGVIYAIASLTITPDSAGMWSESLLFVTLTTILRTPRPSRHPTTGWHTDCLLCVDAQRAWRDDEGSDGPQTDGQGDDVQETVVEHLWQHHRHLWLLLLQLLCLCRPQRPRVRATALEDALVRPGRLAQPGLHGRHCLRSLSVATDRQQSALCHE